MLEGARWGRGCVWFGAKKAQQYPLHCLDELPHTISRRGALMMWVLPLCLHQRAAVNWLFWNNEGDEFFLVCAGFKTYDFSAKISGVGAELLCFLLRHRFSQQVTVLEFLALGEKLVGTHRFCFWFRGVRHILPPCRLLWLRLLGS